MVRYYNELTRLEMEQVDKDETVVMSPVGALEHYFLCRYSPPITQRLAFLV